jgi:hypothetical protein
LCHHTTTFVLISVGPPSAPDNLMVEESGVAKNGVGSLNISWSLADISLVPVNFTTTAVNLNNSEQSLMNVTTQDHFQVLSSNSCGVFQFQVRANNLAGASSSDTISGSFRSLPTSLAEITVQNFLKQKANGTVSLHIVINVSMHRVS